MAINLKFDLLGNPEPPSIVLANRNGNKLGQLNVNVDSIEVSDKFNAASEFSFTLNKYIDDELTPLWDKVKDFKLVYCPEWDLWFEIKVELDEATETVKTVFCTQLGQAELSQIKVYNIHINEEGDPNWDTNNETYKSTILYDKDNEDISLLHRLLKDKAPHYSIAYVDESIQRIQKSFSFDGVSICDAFHEIAEEIGCLFVYDSNSINDVNSDKRGKPSRTISVYDLQQNCLNPNCKHRGEFTDVCPKCNSQDDQGNKYGIKNGYGEDTTIFVTSDELATEGIQLVTDTDSVKNCFKLEGGDDLMTATIRSCNPNGSDYIWYFSDALKEDMPKELVEKLEGYNDKYQDYYKNHPSELNETLVSQYNALVNKYKEYYDTKSTCLNCGHEDYFEEQCPKCDSKNILVGKKLQTINTTINGYPNLMTAYYNTIDLLLYLESSLMPNVDIETNKTTAKEQVELLTTHTLSPVAVNVKEVKNITDTTAKSAVLSMAKVLVKSTYKVDVVDGSSSLDETVYTNDIIGEYKKWTGKFVVTNYSDEEDSFTSETIEVFVGNDAKTFVEQKIEKALNKENTDDYSVTGLFAKEYNDFCVEIKKYALNPLDNFSKTCDAVISILQEQGVGNDGSDEDDDLEKADKKALYDALYKPYFDKQQAINDEIKIRENEIVIIEGVWDKSDENNPKCTTDGLQQYIEKCQQDIQEALDFEKHLGEDLWLEFCAYRREDKYSNSNYVSDGLNNAELFERANEFIEVAEEEIFKSAELQHSISAALNNLLSLPKFKPLLKSFKTGNWIRVQVDDKIYKLRLLEYSFEYGDSESISVEFSDVTKIKNGVTDVKKVLKQASSMVSSYDSVQRQAEKGNVARSTIDQWIVDGLDNADVQIKNNNSEEILLTKSGLLARSYDDITGTYAPEQFKLTHNIMAYTDDNWKTVSSALGKHSYNKWNGSSFIDDEGYGLTSKFVTAGYITGSQIIGGEIVSSNYQIGESGTYLNLIKGDFDFAGGKIVYNADKNRVTLSGVEIQWDSVNQPTIENIDGLSGITKDIRIIEQGLNATTLNGQYVISPCIIGGYLNIKNSVNNTGVVIDPNGLVNDDYIFRVYKGSTTAIGLDVDGNAEFSGTINGSHFIGGDLLIGDKDKIDDYAEITNDGTLTCTNVDILGGTLKIGRYEVLDENDEPETDDDGNIIYGWNTWIDENGILKTNESVISGTMYAGAGSIGGFTIEPVKDENGDTVGGWLYSSGKELGTYKSIFLSATDMSGTVSNTVSDYWRLTIGEYFGVINDGTAYMSNCEITGGSLRMGTEGDGYHTWISSDGVLNANGVNISGEINAVKGAIAGWQITTDALYKNTSGISSGMCSIQTKATSSEGLKYTLNSDGDSYTVAGIGECTDKNIIIPSIYNDKFVTSIGVNAFSGCSSLMSIIIPDTVTSIDSCAFLNCTSLADVVIPEGVTSIGNSAFANCTSFKNIEIPEGITDIEHSTFDGCSSLTAIVIPSSVTSILIAAFANCENLTEVYYAGSSDEWGRIDIDSENDCLKNALYYYNSSNSCISLVDSNSKKISPPCFFAGSIKKIPTFVDEAKFLVLEDGSLYANAADISGTINATSGKIGGLTLKDNNLITDNFSILNGNTDNGVKTEVVLDGLLTATNVTTKQLSSTKATLTDVAINKKCTIGSLQILDGVLSSSNVGIDMSCSDSEYATKYTISIQNTSNLNYDFVLSITPTPTQIINCTFAYESVYSGEQVVDSCTFSSNSTEYYVDTGWYWGAKNKKIVSVNGEDVTEGESVTVEINDGSNIVITGNMVPLISNTQTLGNKDTWWSGAYLGSSIIVTSDKNVKNSIEDISDSYSTIFDSLIPVSYKYNDGTSNRTHTGFIAQDVKNAVENAGLTTQDFAAYCDWINKDGSTGCALRYEEFIALCVNEIQKLKKRVQELENK